MIGRVYRGGRVAGLVRYLWGPGRHNEHVDPHLVACWRGAKPAVLAEVEPALLAVEGGDSGDGFDVGALVASLEVPVRLRQALTGAPAGPRVVWHCPLRLADGDRELSDAEWAEIAQDLLRRTGLDPAAGKPGAPSPADARELAGCRWVAVRHDAVSIHVVVLLARSDGSAANPRFDYRRVRETCLAAEQRYGLRVTAPIDGTASPAVTRAETEKALRGGADSSPRTRVSGEQARVALRREVRRCAVVAGSEQEFLALLRRRGLVVRERHSTRPPVPFPAGPAIDGFTGTGTGTGTGPEVTGYAVGLPGDRDAAGGPVLYSGGRLGPDLTLPRLRHRWTGPTGTTGTTGQAAVSSRADAFRAAARQATAARDALHAVGRAPSSSCEEEELLTAAGDALVAAAGALEGRLRGPLTQAAARYERAGRIPRSRPYRSGSPAGQPLAQAARAVARAGVVRSGAEAQAALQLVRALLRLTDAVAQLHEQRDRVHAAEAAAATSGLLRDWQHHHNLAGQQEAALSNPPQVSGIPTRGATPGAHPPGASRPRPGASR